jgi:hypothetical protein
LCWYLLVMISVCDDIPWFFSFVVTSIWSFTLHPLTDDIRFCCSPFCDDNCSLRYFFVLHTLWNYIPLCGIPSVMIFSCQLCK